MSNLNFFTYRFIALRIPVFISFILILIFSSHCMEVPKDLDSQSKEMVSFVNVTCEKFEGIQELLNTQLTSIEELKNENLIYKNRISSLEQFRDGISNKSPSTIKLLPADKIFIVSVVGGIIATALYYYNPTLASPFIFIYFVQTIYGFLKGFRDVATVANMTPMFNKKS